MKAFRILLGDRATSGPLIALLALALLAQAFLPTLGLRMAASGEAGPLLSICHGSGTSLDAPSPPSGPPASAHPCVCILCGSAQPALAAGLSVGLDLGAAYSLRGAALPRPAGDEPAPPPRRAAGLPPDPRGPPPA